MIKPKIITAQNAVGADKAVQELQIILATTVLNDSPIFDGGLLFGLAEGPTPRILWKGQDFFSLEPNDNYPIIAFFYESDPRSQISDTYNEYNFNLIVWFNQDKFFPHVRYRVKEFIINRIQQAFDNDTFRVYTQKNNIYRDFKLTNDNFITEKFDGFRISFKYKKEYECVIPSKMIEFEESEFYEIEFY